MEVKVKWRHDREFRINIQKIHKHLLDTRPFMKSLAITVHKWILRNYETSGGLLKGKRWAKLMRSTLVARKRGGNKPLQDTGRLLKQGWNYDYDKKRATVGHPSEIAAYHETGTGIYGPEHRPYLIKPVNKKALAWPVSAGYGPAKKGHKKMAVVKHVVHPGIRQRRQLPREDEIMPDLVKVSQVWLAKVTK